METALLLPQDCLPPYKRRQKYLIHNMIYRPESIPRARRNGLQGPLLNTSSDALYSEKARRRQTVSPVLFVKGNDAGILPLPVGSSSLPINIPFGDGEMKRGNSKRQKSVPNFTILQRPKHKEATQPPVVTILQRPKQPDKDRDSNKLVKDTNNTSRSKGSGNADVTAAQEFLAPKGGAMKSNAFVLKNSMRSLPLKQFKNATKSDEKLSVQHEWNSTETEKGPVRQDFALEDIIKTFSTTRVGGAMLQNLSSMDPEKTDCMIAKISAKERWAGPAYTTSPSPSSLPLPKFSLPISRVSSPPALGEADMVKQGHPYPGQLSTSLPSLKAGAWDAALATKSLRRMLNLDLM